jgi:hypothetical protein
VFVLLQMLVYRRMQLMPKSFEKLGISVLRLLRQMETTS